MDAKTIIELVSNLGLPIVLIGAMAYFIFLIWQQSKEREERLYTELGSCREVNKKAIETLTLYAERLNVIEVDVKDIKQVLMRHD